MPDHDKVQEAWDQENSDGMTAGYHWNLHQGLLRSMGFKRYRDPEGDWVHAATLSHGNREELIEYFGGRAHAQPFGMTIDKGDIVLSVKFGNMVILWDCGESGTESPDYFHRVFMEDGNG